MLEFFSVSGPNCVLKHPGYSSLIFYLWTGFKNMLSTVTSCYHTKGKIAFNQVLVNKEWGVVSSSLHTLQERHLQAEVKSSEGTLKW